MRVAAFKVAGVLLVGATLAGLVAATLGPGWVSHATFSVVSGFAAWALSSAKHSMAAFVAGYGVFAFAATGFLLAALFAPHGLGGQIFSLPWNGIGGGLWFRGDAWLPIVALIWTIINLVLSAVPVALLTATLRLRAAGG